jgi:NAD(P)H-nitrite reductase large subunit
VADGADIATDLVVIATGVRPATDLLIRAGADHLPDRSVLAAAIKAAQPGGSA